MLQQVREQDHMHPLLVLAGPNATTRRMTRHDDAQHLDDRRASPRAVRLRLVEQCLDNLLETLPLAQRDSLALREFLLPAPLFRALAGIADLQHGLEQVQILDQLIGDKRFARGNAQLFRSRRHLQFFHQPLQFRAMLGGERIGSVQHQDRRALRRLAMPTQFLVQPGAADGADRQQKQSDGGALHPAVPARNSSMPRLATVSKVGMFAVAAR